MTRGHLRRTGLLAALAALLAVAAAPARADTVTDWNQTAANMLIGTAPPLQPPQITVPHLAMVHGAVYDAVNAIDGGHEGYLLSPRVARPTDSKDAAAATAAHRVLVHLVPAQQAALDAQLASSLAPIPDGRVEAARHRRRRGRGRRDDRGADRRRPLRDSRIPRWHGSGCLAAGAADVRERPERLAQGRRAVPRSGARRSSARTGRYRSRAASTPVSSRRSRSSAPRPTAGGRADQTLAAQYWAENPAGDLEPDVPHAVGAAGRCRSSTTPASSRCCT